MSAPTYVGTISRFRFEHAQLSAANGSSFLVFIPGLLAIILLVACLMLPRRPLLPTRIAFFFSILLMSVLSMQKKRTIGLVYGVLVGLSSSFCVILSANMLFYYDPARDFKRRMSRVTQPTEGDHAISNTPQDKSNWESMPNPPFKRLFWVLDIVGSLCAIHWTYNSSPATLPHPSSKPSTPARASLPKTLSKFFLIYLSVDTLKELIALDPYFWGYTTSPPPPYILTISPSPSFTRTYRNLVAFAVIYLAINFLSTTGYLVFVHLLGPSAVGPWGEPWAHHPPLGNFSSVTNRGLQGFWGSWWHQWFRIAATTPANAIIGATEIRKDGGIAKSVRIVTAFGISGVIHAAGSYTLWGPSRPIDSFLFFALQPVGIAVQVFGSWVLDRLGLTGRIPLRVRQVTNVGYAAWWLLRTFPLMADDFARGGLWLTEPFPVSALQMVGLGGDARSYPPWGAVGNYS